MKHIKFAFDKQEKAVASTDPEYKNYLSDFLDLYEGKSSQSTKKNNIGEIIPALVVRRNKDLLFFDVGLKSEATLNVSEFEGIETPVVGQSIEVKLLSHEDAKKNAPIISYKMARDTLAWKDIFENFQPGAKIMGRAIRAIKGGIIVRLEGYGELEAFLPGSQLSQARVAQEDINALVENAQVCEYKILTINPERRNIVVSRRAILEEASSQEKEEVIDVLKKIMSNIQALNSGEVSEEQAAEYIGHQTHKGRHFEVRKTSNGYQMVVKGEIKNIATFGLFARIPDFGMDGLLHISDICWGKASTTEDELAKRNIPQTMGPDGQLSFIGSEIEVTIAGIDTEKMRISLGLKQLDQNPVQQLAKEYKPGTTIEGTVTKIFHWGAAVEVKYGIEAFLHVSDMTYDNNPMTKPDQIVKVGQKLQAQIIEMDLEKGRVTIGLKQLENDPWKTIEKDYPVGKKVKAKIVSRNSYGALAALPDGKIATILLNHFSWTTSYSHTSEACAIDDEIEAAVLSTDASAKKIYLSPRMKTENPWIAVSKRLPKGSSVEAIIQTITPTSVKAVFAKPASPQEKEMILEAPVQNLGEVVKVEEWKPGDTVTLTVVEVDQEKVRLNCKIPHEASDIDEDDIQTP